MKRVITNVLSIVMLAISLAGCGNGATELGKSSMGEGFEPKFDKNITGQLTVGGLYDNFEALEAVFSEFKEYYPNIETNYFKIDNYSEAIDKTVIGEEAPEILFIKSYIFDYEDVYENVQTTALKLDDPELGINFDNINSDFIRKDLNGDVVFFPTYMYTFGIVVNEKILSDNNIDYLTNYEKLLEACSRLQNAGYEYPIMGYTGTGTLSSIQWDATLGYLLNSVYGDEKACNALNNRTEDAAIYLKDTLEFFDNFLNENYIDEDLSDSLEDHYNGVIMRFFEGDIPFVITNSETVTGMPKREIKSESFTNSPFDYSFIPFPYDNEGGTMPIFGDYGMVVNKNSENKDIAVEFLRFLSQKDILDEFCDIKGAMRITKDAKQIGHLTPINSYMDKVELFGSDSLLNVAIRAWVRASEDFWDNRNFEQAIMAFYDYVPEN